MENTKPQEQNQEDSKDKKPDTSTPHNDLTKKDIPDSTNESTGVPGSGQRQDSN